MRFVWVKAAAVAVAAGALASCGQGGGDTAKKDAEVTRGHTVAELLGMGGPAAAPAPLDPKWVEAQKAFLEKNAKAPGVKVTASGLQYKIERSGPADGVQPKPGDQVKVHYVGTLSDGKKFESTRDMGEPAVFTVGQLVPGFNEALQLMRPGDLWTIYIPPGLGYGDQAQGDAIPGGSVLVFQMEMLEVAPAGATAPTADG